MILSIYKARDVLHLDGADNDGVIIPLLEVMPDYLEVTTGYKHISGKDAPPLVNTAARFLLQLWYNADGTDVDKLQRTINNLLTAVTVSVRGK